MLNALIVGLYGLVIGSFLGALIRRLHSGRSITKGRSACEHCGHTLGALDLVPAVSWLMLGGKCRYCRKPIGWQELLIEVATGVLFALSYVDLRPEGVAEWVQFVVWLVVLSASIALTVYDLRWYLLPDVIVVPVTALVVLMLVVGRVAGVLSPDQITSHTLAALAAGGIFYALASLAGGKLMGGGDVKLVFLMGLVLGGQRTITAMAIGFYSAAIVGVGLIVAGRKKRKDYIPFGPFLIAGLVIAYLYGAEIAGWYTGLIEHIIL